MISPIEFSQIHDYDEDLINKIIEKIDNQLRGPQLYNEAVAIIEGEYSVLCRNEVARRYVETGWYRVLHRCSSEHGEPHGLTNFTFFTKDSFKEFLSDSKNWSSSYHVVENST